ncbi:MAG: hypothetical protein QOI41_7260 [Myxococcales bacterium]|jgi:hypothetical protein|nr:hypothetical protein [Myxococcales bacterium]
MTRNFIKLGLGVVLVSACLLAKANVARADDAIVTVGQQRFSEPPEETPPPRHDAPLVLEEPRFGNDPRELHRSPFRLQLGPQGVTTGKGFGVGVGVAADFGTGSVGGRIAASWLRGEGNNGDGSSTPTGDSIGIYTGEVTLDLHKRGPVHPVVGMGVGLLHVSRSDSSGIAGVGTGRLGLEYSLGLEDADVRIGASVTGGLIGPVDSDVKDLRAYALVGAHLAIGF